MSVECPRNECDERRRKEDLAREREESALRHKGVKSRRGTEEPNKES